LPVPAGHTDLPARFTNPAMPGHRSEDGPVRAIDVGASYDVSLARG
jgi:hypothetical protein